MSSMRATVIRPHGAPRPVPPVALALARVSDNAARIGVGIADAKRINAGPVAPPPLVAGLDARVDQIRGLIGMDAWRQLFGREGRTNPTRRMGHAEARTVVYRILRVPIRAGFAVPSYPEVARAVGGGTHSTSIAAMHRTIKRDQLPEWCLPLWALAESLGLVKDGVIEGRRAASNKENA